VVVGYGLEGNFSSFVKVFALIYGIVKWYDASIKLMFTFT